MSQSTAQQKRIMIQVEGIVRKLANQDFIDVVFDDVPTRIFTERGLNNFVSDQKSSLLKEVREDEKLWEYLRNPNCLAAKLRLEKLLKNMEEEAGIK